MPRRRIYIPIRRITIYPSVRSRFHYLCNATWIDFLFLTADEDFFGGGNGDTDVEMSIEDPMVILDTDHNWRISVILSLII